MRRQDAERIVDAIMFDLNDRGGFELDALDRTTLEEIRDSWIEIVNDTGEGHPAFTIPGE